MNQSVKFSVKIISMLASAFITSSFASPVTDAKTIIRVDLDANAKKAHHQLQLLKKMDVLGMNRKQHWVEVAVTNDELAQLQAQHLLIRKAVTQLNNLRLASDGYLHPEQVIQALENIHLQYPNMTKLFEVGKTHEQRSIMGIEISAHVGDVDKPTIVFNGMHHAREVMTSEIVMHIAKVLTENYGKDTEVTSWLDQYRIVLVPQVNPDGNARVWSGEPMWRKNAFQINGSIVGVDLNRNYPAYWNYCDGSSGQTYSEIYRGPSAGSEPETQAMMNLVNTYKPVAEISYHSYSEMIIYPYGCSNVNNPSRNLFDSIGQDLNAKIRNDDNQTNAYEVGTPPELLYEVDGGDIDWMWKQQGVFAFVIEVNSYGFHPDYKTWRDVTVERQVGGWQAMLRRMSQSGFRAHVQSATPNELSYSLKKIEGKQKIAFDTDQPKRTFKLKSSRLLYQLTEKGRYEVTFFVKNQAVKSFTINVGDTLVDLGDIVI